MLISLLCYSALVNVVQGMYHSLLDKRHGGDYMAGTPHDGPNPLLPATLVAATFNLG